MTNARTMKYPKKRSAFYHVGAWLVYVLAMYLINRLNEHPPGLLSVVAVTVLFVLVFYLVLFVLRKFFDRKRYLWGSLALLGSYALLPLLTYGYIYLTLPKAGIVIPLEDMPFSVSEFFKSVLIGTIRFSVYALVYYLVGKKRRSERERNRAVREKLTAERDMLRMERDKLQYELAALGMQLNPHLLYNIINKLYAGALKVDDRLAQRMLLLSSLAEYAARVPKLDKGLVPAEQEWEMVKTLWQLLFDSSPQTVILQVEGQFDGQLLPPFSFITLFENALKHGVSSDPDDPILLQLTLEHDRLVLNCSNSIRRTNDHAVSLGSGLANLRRRLEITFGDHAVLRTEKQANRFYAHLSIAYE